MRRVVVGARMGVLYLCALAGCSFHQGDLTMASSKNVPLSETLVRRGVEGKDCIQNVLGIPLGSLVPDYKEAADNALATAPGANALSDAVIYQEPLIFLLYNRTCIRVRGDAVTISTKGEGSR